MKVQYIGIVINTVEQRNRDCSIFEELLVHKLFLSERRHTFQTNRCTIYEAASAAAFFGFIKTKDPASACELLFCDFFA